MHYTWFSSPWNPCKLEHILLPITSGPRLACTSSGKTVQSRFNTVEPLITNYLCVNPSGYLPVSGKIISVSLFLTSPPNRLPVKWKFKSRKSSTFEKKWYHKNKVKQTRICLRQLDTLMILRSLILLEY